MTMTSAPELNLPMALPPAAPDCEKETLGWILLCPDRFGDLALERDDFSIEAHRRIHGAMGRIHEAGSRIDRVALIEELRNQGQLESVGGMSFVISLDEGVPALPNVDNYLTILREKRDLRTLLRRCHDTAARAMTGQWDVDQLRAELEAGLRGLSDGAKTGQWPSVYDVALENIEQIVPSARGAAGIPTPLRKLTDLLGGLNAGELVIVAGRPGMGKSVYALQQAGVAAKAGYHVAIFSLEMTGPELVRRQLAHHALVDAHRLRSGHLSASDRQRVLECAADLEGLPIFIDDTGAFSPATISAALRRLKAKHPVDLVIIDHLQLMRTSGRAESRNHEISEISGGFKRLALSQKCTVMLLSQLSRECEKERRRPQLSDLRDSGSIEQDADNVLFVHRPEMYKRDDRSLRGQAELIVAKQRNGPIGKVHANFIHEHQYFSDATGEVAE